MRMCFIYKWGRTNQRVWYLCKLSISGILSRGWTGSIPWDSPMSRISYDFLILGSFQWMEYVNQRIGICMTIDRRWIKLKRLCQTFCRNFKTFNINTWSRFNCPSEDIPPSKREYKTQNWKPINMYIYIYITPNVTSSNITLLNIFLLEANFDISTVRLLFLLIFSIACKISRW